MVGYAGYMTDVSSCVASSACPDICLLSSSGSETSSNPVHRSTSTKQQMEAGSRSHSDLVTSQLRVSETLHAGSLTSSHLGALGLNLYAVCAVCVLQHS